MSVSVDYLARVTVTETIENSVPDVLPANGAIKHDQFNTAKTLNADTTPPATLTASFSKALSSGAATIDLTALTGSNGAAVDLTGLKVQVLRLLNPIANANNITIAKGASNGFVPAAGSAFNVTLAPGQEITIYGNDATGDVGSGAKTLDLTGTGSQALKVQIVAG